MRTWWTKLIVNIIFILLIAGASYYYRSEITQFVDNKLNIFRPCQKPTTYSLGTFDTNFGISKEDFLNTVAQAGKIWESPINKRLFQYTENTENADMKINLIYDTRQQSTDKLKELGTGIGNDKESYDALKARYNDMNIAYKADKVALEKEISSYQVQKDAYEKEVTYWNNQGGAPENKYSELEQKKNELNAQADSINNMESSLNSQVNTMNALVSEINKLARNLNLKVETFNATGSYGEEFNEGEYISDRINKKINVYQFEDKNKLLRVLAHEMGHSLGLEHVEDPKAIMYRLNQSSSEKLTPDDITELKRVCQIK